MQGEVDFLNVLWNTFKKLKWTNGQIRGTDYKLVKH